MDWEQHLEVRPLPCDLRDRAADLGDIVAPVFAPMHRDQQMAAASNGALDSTIRAGPLLRVDHGVAGQADPVVIDALALERGE